MASWHADFLISEWRVSPKLSRVYKDGRSVSVKRKPMAVLVCLADANGEVVTRDDIMDQVWPGRVVTDDVLTQSVVELRKAFDDDAKHPRVIETIPTVGFRLITIVAPTSVKSSGDASLPLDFQPPTALPADLALRRPAFLREEAQPIAVEDSLFVAREAELDWLSGYLDKVLVGKAQVVFITGEAGQGKTSLLEAFSRRTQRDHPELIVAGGSCDMYKGVGSPFLPFRDVLNMLTGDVESLWHAGLISYAHALKLWHLIPHSVQALTTVGEDLIGTLVSAKALAGRAASYAEGMARWLERLLETNRRAEVFGSGRASDQNRVFEEYTAVLSSLAADRPLLLILDDLHWADPSSIGLLMHLGQRLTDSPILVVGSYRPEDVALGREGDSHPLTTVLSEFKRRQGDIWLDLDRIAHDQARDFVDAVLDSEPNRLCEDFRQAIVSRTGGRPLFTLELLRDMQERGELRRDETGHWIAGSNLHHDVLPPRVEGVIEMRIERLEPELRNLLSVASVEGESFTAEVVANVLAVEERELIPRFSGQLDRKHHLIKGQGVQQLASQRLSKYMFRHNLFQVYLYQHLGEVERIHLHESVGSALEQLHEGQTEDVAVQLARHFERAQLTEKAIKYRLLAGDRAARSAALAEAISHYRKGLKLIEMLPDTPERANRELTLLAPLGAALTAIEGYTAEATKAAYTRAYELSRHVGHTAQIFHVLYGVWNFLFVGAELDKARELAAEGLRLAGQQQDAMPHLVAHDWMGVTMAALGKLEDGREHLEAALSYYDRDQHRGLIYQCGEDPRYESLSHLAIVLWLMGYPDQAKQYVEEAIGWGLELEHAQAQAYTLNFGIILALLRRDWQFVAENAEKLVLFSTEQLLLEWTAIGNIFRGAALIADDDHQRGIEQLLEGLQIWETSIFGPYLLSLLAQGYQEMGQTDKAIEVLHSAITNGKQTGEVRWDAELYRLKGESLLSASEQNETEAESLFRRAISVAIAQRARSLELRASVSLCRLLQEQGKGDEGHRMLSEIYDWFTEGFDTGDLIEAKKLLEDT